MISAYRIIASFAAFSLLGACGLKGPLYLPKEPAEEQEPATPPKSTSQETPKQEAPPAKSSTPPKAPPTPDDSPPAQ